MHSISDIQLSSWSSAYAADEKRQLATLALSKANINDIALVKKNAFAMRQKFSVEIKTMRATAQNQSGRCWLFAATNVLRERIAAQKNLEEFELSQSYLAFWDKFERCNYYLESIIATASLPVADRTVTHILTTGVHDGGQWDMFANIIAKYGIVPKDAYDETAQTGCTRNMNAVLNQALKVGAIRIRAMIRAGSDETDIQNVKAEILGKVYAFLCSCYTEPPKQFDFEYVDKDGEYHIEKGYTPLSFAQRYVGDLADRCVSIINAPTDDKPYHKTFTIRFLGNVVGGRDVKHLNLTMDEFKAAIIAQLKDGKVVWFGSDCGKYGQREEGIWDDACYNMELATGLELYINKADGLDYGYAAMNHAMVLTGVNLDENGTPNRWRIENSWGEERGSKGYFVCSDSWFDRFVFQAAVEPEYLGELASLTAQEPAVLEPWDPMGTLAD